jgi:hypothetical protein
MGELPQLYGSNSSHKDHMNGVVQPVHHPHIHNHSATTAAAVTAPWK